VRVLDARRDLWIDLYLDFRGNLREALTTGDPAIVRTFLRTAGRQLGDVELMRTAALDDERLRILIARLTLADPLLVTRHRSARQVLRRTGAAAPQAASGYGRPNFPFEQERRSA
jgi:hypothetical protein